MEPPESRQQETAFVADAMLGKLAKWLRVLGFDVAYQSRYAPGELTRLTAQGRRLLTRRADRADTYALAVRIFSERVGRQLAEMKHLGLLPGDAAAWFTRCIRCNTFLRPADPAQAFKEVPDYVFHETERIRWCPTCGRFYWPGTHRTRMRMQLQAWGIVPEQMPESAPSNKGANGDGYAGRNAE